MANTFSPFGFMQDAGTGSTPTYEQAVRQAQYNAAAIYRGDPITSQADGTVAISDPAGAPTVQIAGVFQGAKYLSVSQQRTVWNGYWPGTDVASGQYPDIYFVNDPNAQFIAQADDTGLTLADVNANAVIAIGSPNAYTKQSGAYITSAALTSTLPFRILGIVTTPALSYPDPTAGAYALAIVGFNNVDTKSLAGL